MKKYYSIPDFAKALGVSRTTVQRMIQNNQIKAVKKNPFGGRTSPLLISADQLAWVRKMRDVTPKS